MWCLCRLDNFLIELFYEFAVMHDLRMIHTDLKPENILLVSPEYVKVPDYKVPVILFCFRLPAPYVPGTVCTIRVHFMHQCALWKFWFIQDRLFNSSLERVGPWEHRMKQFLLFRLVDESLTSVVLLTEFIQISGFLFQEGSQIKCYKGYWFWQHHLWARRSELHCINSSL